MKPCHEFLLVALAAMTVAIPSRIGLGQVFPGEVLLNLDVPEHALVYINGRRTHSRGQHRQYRSEGLLPGRKYPYDIRVVVVSDGAQREQTRHVLVQSGQSVRLAFRFDPAGVNATPDPPKGPAAPRPKDPSQKAPAPVNGQTSSPDGIQLRSDNAAHFVGFKPRAVLNHPHAAHTRVEFTSDGKTLITSDIAGGSTIVLWDVATGTARATIDSAGMESDWHVLSPWIRM